MQYALTPRIFLFSHYFYTGLRIAVGVVGLTLLTLYLSNLPTALAVAMGALCTSLMDMPSPLRHKFNEMLAGVLLCSLVALVVSLSTPYRWLLAAIIVLVSFLASLMVVYGRKAMPLQFAAIFIMMLSTETLATPRQALAHAAMFFAGGMAYLAYAMVVVWLLQRRLKQQVLAEALYELVRYIEIKADCYDESKDLNAQFEKLVRQQSVLAEKQQASRDLILRGRLSEGDAALVQVHYAMFDLYELVMATHTDYALLRRYFSGSPVLALLRDVVRKAARDVESVAYAMMSDGQSHGALDYAEQLAALARLSPPPGDGEEGEASAVLNAAVANVTGLITIIGQLHAASQAKGTALPVLPGQDLTPFLTQQRYELGVLLASLRWSSPIFRFALRVAMAISAGLAVADYLPYSSHGYWIALTIAVILKPSFSTTRQRRADRLIGTVIGCVLTALILRFVHAPAALIGLMFLATAAAPAFLHVRYRYTAVAASMQILLLIGLTVPNAQNAAGERLLDTLIGALIASFFSYVLPSWEYQALPRLLQGVLKASAQYVEASRELLLARGGDDFRYRISRKRLMDNLASLSAALGRMLEEPRSKHRAVACLNRFIVQNYLLVSHFAALRLLLQRFREGLPEAEVRTVVDATCQRVKDALDQAQRGLDGTHPVAGAERADGNGAGAANLAWAGAQALQRRARLLLDDARQISASSALVGEALRRAD